MPIKVKEEDNGLYIKVLIGFSIVQVLLAMLLFVVTAVSKIAWISLAAVAAVGIFLVYKFWDDKKPLRVILRIVEYIVVIAPLILFAVAMISSLIQAEGKLQQTELSSLYIGLCLVAQVFLLFMLPLMAVAASRGHGFDVITMRIFSVIELAIALFTCFYYYNFGDLLMGVENVYFRTFFCLCVAVTAVASFVVFPITWRPQWLLKVMDNQKKKRDAAAAARDTEQPPEAASGAGEAEE
mgnify:CR=1 FL=1